MELAIREMSMTQPAKYCGGSALTISFHEIDRAIANRSSD
jgi:hypothetical protein